MSDPKQPDKPPKGQITGRQVYNLVTDVAVGPNVRWKDNLYQGIIILICLGLGVSIGALVTPNRGLGAVTGGFVGVLVGLFGSGIFLMLFRVIRHSRGKHD